MPAATQAARERLGPFGVHPLAGEHGGALQLFAAVVDQVDHRVDVGGHPDSVGDQGIAQEPWTNESNGRRDQGVEER